MELGLRLADPGLERRSVRRRLACALFATTALVAASPAAAQVTTWQAGTGSWFVGGNWDNGVPTNADITNVFNGGTAQIAGPAAEAQSLTIRGGSTVDVQAGGSLVVGLGGVPIGFITINTGGGTLLLSGSTAVNATRLVLDDDNATLRAGTTGTFNVPTIWLGTGRTPTIAATAGNILTLTGDIQFFDNATARFGSVTDTGTVVLNPGAVTVGFTPAIEVAGGSLRAANSNALPTQAAVTVNSGATLQIDPGGVFSGIGSLAGAGFVAIGAGSSLSAGFNGTSTTFSGAITGGGSFEYSGAGTLALTGANTIGGNLTICNCATGVLDINGGSFIVGGVTTVFDGTLQVSNGGVLTTAGLTRIGAADPAFMTILSGGVVNSQGGALIDAATGTPTATVSGAGSTWNVTGGLTIGNALFGGVANLIAADGGVVNSDTTTIGPGSTLNLGTGALAGAIVTSQIANGGAIVANFTDTLTLAAAITGAGTLTKQGPGTLILTGASTYTGATNVTGGILNVNGSLVSTVNVNAGTLMGTGAIGGLLNNGTVAPGNSIGTLTVNGNATFNSGGVYQVEFSPAAADRINVTGTATLGGTVQAVALPGSFSPRTYTILNAAGGVTGTFSNLTVTGAPGAGNAQLGYDANNVFLQIDPSLISPQLPTGTPRNPAAVANSIDRAVLGGATPPPAFDALFNFSGTGLVNALTQLSGEVAAGFRPASHLSMGLFLNAMLDPFVGGRNRGFGAANAYAPEKRSRARDAFAAALPVKAQPKADTFDNRWAVWGTAYGGRTRTDGDPVVGSSDMTDSAAGFTAGADYKVSPALTLGAAVAIGETRWNVGFGSGNSNLGQIGGYAAAQWNSFYLSAALAGAWHNAETERTVAVAGLERLEADFDATMFGARLEGGWRYDIGRFGLIPHAAFQVQRVHTSAYGERATIGPGDFALNYAAQTVTDTRTELGLWADTAHALANGAILTLRARAAWMHDFDPQTRVNAVFQALPGSNFTVEGAASARDAALLSAAGELQLANGVTLLARFDGEFSGRATMYGGTGTVRYQW